LAAAVFATAAAGCGDDAACGAGDAPAQGVTATAGDTTVTYGAFQAAANNDCRTASPPAGVVSLTVFGGQADPAGAAFVTLCLPRPDLLADGSTVALSGDVQPVPDDARVQVIDVQAALPGDCAWTIGDAAPTGTATFEGFCDQGVAAAGFALTLDGTVTVDETCAGGAATPRQVTLAGRVAVAPQ
ncbi:MAG: hypothetical protein KC464_18935, partial [Myxococcales bacterium]|nr:hypothetical protein [Myxococcales bacterium]